MKEPLFILVLCLIQNVQTAAQIVANRQDSLELVRFYNSTGGPSWTNHSGWLTQRVSSWFGVTLDASGGVAQIHLGGNNLSGALPDFNFPSLIFLDLQVNKLTNELPTFSNMRSLQYMWLGQNQFAGSIPDFNLPNLRDLYLGQNQLTGSLPNFSSLTALQNINIEFNQFSGGLPNWNLPNLIMLDVNFDQLSGRIPALDKMPKLQYLFLLFNHFEGPIPTLNLPNLLQMKLQVNNLSGAIPDFNMPNLTILDLSFNQLTDSVPNFRLPNLKELNLNYNQLSGTIPAFKFPNLTTLALGSNMFTFKGLEYCVSTFPFATYTPQDTILHVKRTDSTLSVSAGGTINNNTYKWYAGSGQLVQTKNGDSTLIVTDDREYYVEVTNSIATQLKLRSDTTSTLLLIDPNPLLVNNDGSLKQDISGIDLTKKVNGAVTDGVTKLLLVTNSKEPLQFSLSSEEDGSLTTLNNQGQASTKTGPLIPNNGKIVAVYTAPDGYGANNYKGGRTITIKVEELGNGTSTDVKVMLVTPPVILIHGMWSDAFVWERGGFSDFLRSKGFVDPQLVDYGSNSQRTFNPNSPESYPARGAIESSLKQVLNEYRDNRRIAVTQVDVVAHSLGGLMARSYSQQATFINTTNFNRGYYHKLITIGTPHRGSPLGPELYNNKDIAVFYPLYIGTLGSIMAQKQMPIGSVHADFARQSVGLTALTETLPYKTFSITADYTGGVSGNLGYKELSSITYIALKKTLDEIMLSGCLGNSTLKHDLIVPISSQKGFVSGGKDATFSNTVHSDLPKLNLNTETSSINIQTQVADLLLSNDKSQFGVGYPAPSVLLSADPCGSSNQRLAADSKNLNMSTVYKSQYIKINSPVADSKYTQGSGASITLSFEAFNGAVPDKAVFMIDGVGWYEVPNTPPYSTTIPLPNLMSVGRRSVLAFVRDTSGILLADTTSIFINANLALDHLIVQPVNIELDSSLRQRSLYVKGYFGNNGNIMISDLTTASAGTSYARQRTSVFTISPNGLITALGPGRDTLTVTNGNISSRVVVTVSDNFSKAAYYDNKITFPAVPDRTFGDQPLVLSASATSGDDVIFSVTSGPAVLQNGVLSATAPGKVTVKASQAGSVYFAPASDVIQSFCVNPTQPSAIKGDTLACTTQTTYAIQKSTSTSYRWEISDGGSMNSTDTSVIITWNTPGRYTIGVTPFVGECSGTKRMLNITVIRLDTPTVTPSGNKLVSSAKAGNQWFLNGTPISGANDTTYIPVVSGRYSVQVTADGCSSARSTEFSYAVTGIIDLLLGDKVTIYPNPAKDQISIKNNSNETLYAQLFDITGRRLIHQTINIGSSEISIAPFPKGSYIVRLTGAKTKGHVKKLIIKK